MSQPPLRPPAELIEALVRALCFALEAQTQSFVARLARPLMSLISGRIIGIGHRFRRYVERIEAGRPFPSRRAGVPAPAPFDPPLRKPAPDPLPRHVGWLEKVLPNIVPLRAQLSIMLSAPEVVAVIEAAPEQMGRVLRPLCRMLGLPPPPCIAPPPRRRPVRRPKPPPEPLASWPHDTRKRDKWGFYIGPPPIPSIAHLLGPGRSRKPG
jgi:hypothetical protein